MPAPSYVNALDHPIDLADGSVVGPGHAIRLTAEQAKDDHNKQLIEDKTLAKAGAPDSTTSEEDSK